MIQRKQTLWLLLASLCAFAGLKISFYYVSIGITDPQSLTNILLDINGMVNLWLNIFSISCGVLCIIAIFLFRNRKLQQRISFTALLTELMVLIGYYQTIKKYTEAKPALGSVLQLMVLIAIIMAIRGMRNDDKIIAESERLR